MNAETGDGALHARLAFRRPPPVVKQRAGLDCSEYWANIEAPRQLIAASAATRHVLMPGELEDWNG